MVGRKDVSAFVVHSNSTSSMNNDAVHNEEITKNKIIRKFVTIQFKFSRSCCIDTKEIKQKRVILAGLGMMLVSPDVRGKGIANEKKKLIINNY